MLTRGAAEVLGRPLANGAARPDAKGRRGRWIVGAMEGDDPWGVGRDAGGGRSGGVGGGGSGLSESVAGVDGATLRSARLASKDTSQSLRNAKRAAAESEAIGAATLQALQEQGETLRRAHGQLDEVRQTSRCRARPGWRFCGALAARVGSGGG